MKSKFEDNYVKILGQLSEICDDQVNILWSSSQIFEMESLNSDCLPHKFAFLSHNFNSN